MKEILSRADLLIKKLETIEAKMNQFIDLSEVGHVNWDEVKRNANQGIYVIPPGDHYWKKDDGSQLKIQAELKQLYSEWKEQFDLLFQHAPESVVRKIEEVHNFIISWIERDGKGDYAVQATLKENKVVFKERTEVFHKLIKSLSDPETCETLLIPDTSALIICSKLPEYSQLINTSTFIVVLIPTVLQELDELQLPSKSPDPDFRKKVSSIIRQIKGFRHQGDLRTGVTTDKTITVKSIAKEPNFGKTLHWLDSTVPDDRIIATVLEIQRENLTSRVLLVTNDINLQNKADAASIPALEPPKIKGTS